MLFLFPEFFSKIVSFKKNEDFLHSMQNKFFKLFKLQS